MGNSKKRKSTSEKLPPKLIEGKSADSSCPQESPAPPLLPRGAEYVALAGILLLGVILRLWYLSQIVHAPDFAAPQQDPAVFDWYARALVTGDWTVGMGAASRQREYPAAARAQAVAGARSGRL